MRDRLSKLKIQHTLNLHSLKNWRLGTSDFITNDSLKHGWTLAPAQCRHMTDDRWRSRPAHLNHKLNSHVKVSVVIITIHCVLSVFVHVWVCVFWSVCRLRLPLWHDRPILRSSRVWRLLFCRRRSCLRRKMCLGAFACSCMSIVVRTIKNVGSPLWDRFSETL